MQTKRFEHTDTEYRENGKYKISQPHYYRALSLKVLFLVSKEKKFKLFLLINVKISVHQLFALHCDITTH